MLPLLLALLLLGAAPAAARNVSLIEIDGPIGPAAAEYVADSLRNAQRAREPVVVLRVDTPGGLDASVRSIVRALVTSTVPVAVWVGPSDARAAGAGLLLVAAAHVAAMAPGTNLVAADPLAMAEKGRDESAASIGSLSGQRGRDSDWFERAVVEGAGLSAEEALEAGVVDLLAPTVEAVLAALDGREVSLVDRRSTLGTQGLVAVPVPMSLWQRALEILSNPNVAYLLLLLGFYGLFFEVSNPGSIVPGVLGGLCLVLAFLGIRVLPFHFGGVLLILLGLLLLLLEVKIHSFGLLTLGGVAGLTLGSLLLFRTGEAFHSLSYWVLVPSVGATVAFFAFAVGKGLAAQRVRPVSGVERLVGERGRALTPIGPGLRGRVFVHGEYWNAMSEEAMVEGAEVEVLEVAGMELRVGPLGAGRRE